MPLSFLLGLRWHLTTWGYSKQEVKVSEEDLVMSINKVPVLKATVEGKSLQLKWFEKFDQWDALQSCGELAKLISAANEKLSKIQDPAGKGKGKRVAGSR